VVPPIPAAATPAPQLHTADQENALRRVGVLLLLVYVFVRFSYITDTLGYWTDSKTFLVIVLGVPLAILTVISGGLRRAFRARPTFWASGLMLWMVFVLPFGFWRSGSLHTLFGAFQTEFSILFMIAGMVFTMREFQRVAITIAWATGVVILSSFVFGVSQIGRFSFSFGTLSNANDYATHLIVVLPFVLLVVLNSRTAAARILGVGVALLGTFLVVKTGSRAGLLSLALVYFFLFLRGTQAQRVALGLAAVVLSAAAVIALPRTTLLRYALLADSSVDEEDTTDRGLAAAVGSGSQRKELLMDSLVLTALHPLVGVGPGNFAPAAADRAGQAGQRGKWLLSHNTYTEISSETGVPGLILLLGMFASSFAQLRSIYRRTRHQLAYRAIHNTAFCMMLSLIGFCICIFFASMSYRFYFPALVGLVVSFAAAAQFELDRNSVPSKAGPEFPRS
jgi:O-antigen ligase